jgi:SAM-dependent methyltransferase
MQTDPLRIERYFNRRAPQFDALYSEDRGWRYLFNRFFRRPLYERVHYAVAAFQDLQDFTVLDVGCGSGRNSVVFAKSGARRVVGIDFSERMITLARESARQHRVADRCEFLCDDALTHVFAEKFDFVVALGVFDYLREPEPLLRRMAKLANHIVIASFPGWSILRAPLRKTRYWLRDCPVHFSTRRRMQQICRWDGLGNYDLIPLSGRAGWVLVASVRQATIHPLRQLAPPCTTASNAHST